MWLDKAETWALADRWGKLEMVRNDNQSEGRPEHVNHHPVSAVHRCRVDFRTHRYAAR
jgi:hypothetical protein